MHHALTLADMLARLGIALGLGAAIGLEREVNSQPAGLRTHVLVSLGASLFTAAGMVFGPRNDLTRVASGVVTGIGFLGAGAILVDRGRIKGLTTAASLCGSEIIVWVDDRGTIDEAVTEIRTVVPSVRVHWVQTRDDDRTALGLRVAKHRVANVAVLSNGLLALDRVRGVDIR